MPKHKKHTPTYAFIDGANILFGCKDSGWKMDYAKLSKYLKERFNVTKILYYAGNDPENLKQISFYEKLQDYDYKLRLVPLKIFKDGKKKADVDSKMTFEMMDLLKEYESAVVLTGDGDFFWVFQNLIEKKNKKLFLLSFSKNTARELKKLFGPDFYPLKSLKEILQFKNKKHKK